ncbi:MAG: RnfABCDGE type electron transport complex subunit D [Nanobdellota archaeon]
MTNNKDEGKTVISDNPHMKGKENVRSIMWYVVLALLPVVFASVYFFGMSAVKIISVSIVTAVLTEFTIQKLAGKKVTIQDGSAVLTGLLLALVLSPTVPWWIPFIGAIVSISIGKHVFGGLGQNIFNPALVGRAFLVISWSGIMTEWVSPDGITGATPLGMLKQGGGKAAYENLLIGNIGGCIGETSAIAILIGGAFLLYKGIIDWRIPFGFIGTAAVFSLILGQDPVFHILAGGLLIGAFFMATDYVTSPITPRGRLIFGAGCGSLTIILRLFSGYPEGVMFSILFMNMVVPLIDRFTKRRPFGAKQ